ncbi:MAG TPA: mechanosensitive ion channel domain-containing protein, partial [Candidatus Methylomirabilis sp.]|nr:mechanosensitive ion channel domain-containing protein [Candidatus Methylomirabilis sp.]
GEKPSGSTLDALTALWRATRVELTASVDLLTRRATDLEGVMDRLTTLRATWTQTRTEARTSRAPAPVIERIDGVLAAIDASATRLQKERIATLVLQDRVVQEVARCETVLARIAELRHGLSEQVFVQDTPPLWRVEEVRQGLAELPTGLRDVVRHDIAQIGKTLREQRWRIPIQIALFIGLLLLMAAARRRARGWAAQGRPAPGLRVFERPVAAALVVTLLSSTWIYSPPPPRGSIAIIQVLGLALAVRVMCLLVDPSLITGLYVLAGFFLTDLVRRYASVLPLLEQLIFLVEMLAGIALLVWWLVSERRRLARAGETTSRTRAALLIGDRLVLVAFVGAFVVATAGYMSLALLLGSSVVGSGYLALVFYAALRVGDALVAFLLRVRPLRLLGMVERRRSLIEQRAHRLLRGLAVVGWLILVLRYLGLLDWAVTLAQTVLGAQLHRGFVRISLADVLLFAITVWASFLVSALVRFVLEEDVFPRLRLGGGLPQVLSSVLHYALLLTGFLLALAVLGVDFTKITILAGAFGVGIGFGLQNVVNNFVSGIVVLFERRVDVGDAVQIGDVSGRMQQMGIRSCTVRTWDGAEVIVPNATLISDKVTNWTLSDRRRRIDLAVGLGYGTAPEKALELLLGVARAHPQVLSDPAPVALFRGFGESALRFELQCWTDRFDLWSQTQSELAVALYAALRNAGIEIPFPQRDVRLRRE